MKAYLEIKRQTLPNYKSESLMKTLHRSARIHGYHCALWFGIIRWKDHLLNVWAGRCAWNGLRIKLQRWRGVNIGKHVHIGPNVTIDYPFPYFVTIEDGASLAGGNYILAHSTPLEYHQRCTESFVAPVVVHRNAWIGVNAILMPGLEVGEGAIVGAGAVVTQNVPPNTMVAGVPARTIKTFEP